MRMLGLLAGAVALAGAALAQAPDRPEGEEPQAPPVVAAPPAALPAPETARDAEAETAAPEAARPSEAAAAPETAGTPSPDVAALNPLAALDKSALSGFRDMPLFTPSRRRPEPPPVVEAPPPPPPPPPQPRAPAPPPELKLSGVVQGPDGAVAIVQNGDATERLRLGDQVEGWLVTAIESASIKLTLDDREESFRMFERADASGGGTPASSADDEDDGEPAARPNRGGANGLRPNDGRPSPADVNRRQRQSNGR